MLELKSSVPGGTPGAEAGPPCGGGLWPSAGCAPRGHSLNTMTRGREGGSIVSFARDSLRAAARGRYQNRIKRQGAARSVGAREALEHNGRGVELARAGRHEEALPYFERAMDLARDAGEGQDAVLLSACMHKGSSLAELGRHSEALDCFERAIDMSPGDVYAHLDKGSSLAELGRHSEALDCFERAIDLATGDGASPPDRIPHFAYMHKGRLLADLERYEEAVECFERAIAAAPDDYESRETFTYLACMYKGGLLVAMGRHEEAALCYDEALKAKPGDERALHEKAAALAQLQE